MAFGQCYCLRRWQRDQPPLSTRSYRHHRCAARHQIGTGSNGTNEEFVDVVINVGKFVGNHTPIITGLSASSLQVAIGKPVSFSAAATDTDGDPLAYAWDFSEPRIWTQSGLNSSSATRSWTLPGQYEVRTTVSDMKGGIATSSVLVTVGAPSATNQIRGRVLWAGQPLPHARVWSTN